MANSYNQIYVHSIFSTKKRQSLIKPHFEKRVWKYISGIGKHKGFPIITIGGMTDHIHVLISISPKISVSKTIQIIKGSSSKWINDNFYQERRIFQWQSGYSALSVSQSSLKKAIRYIRNQKRHHKKMSFQEEYKGLLNKYEIDWDEKYVFG